MRLAATWRCVAATRALPQWAATRRRSLATAAAASGHPASSGGAESSTRVALVQGSSRGLGLEFVRQLLERPGTRVVATCRAPAAAQQLQALQQQHASQLEIVQLDSTDEGSIARAAEQVGCMDWAAAGHCLEGCPCPSPGCALASCRLPNMAPAPPLPPPPATARPWQVALGTQHLDLLINASGILHDGGMAPETALSRVSMDSLLKCFQASAAGWGPQGRALQAPLLSAAAPAAAPSEVLTCATWRPPATTQVNAAGHILVAKHFAPLLAAAAKANGATE